MNEKRSPIARSIAGAIVLGGVSEAFFLIAWSVEIGFPRGILLHLFFLPGWFAFLALVCAAAGRKLPGDPFTTWIPCALVNGLWLVALGADTDFTLATKAVIYIYVRVYVLLAVVGAMAGLCIELSRTQR